MMIFGQQVFYNLKGIPVSVDTFSSTKNKYLQ